jgi:hypothetical protein
VAVIVELAKVLIWPIALFLLFYLKGEALLGLFQQHTIRVKRRGASPSKSCRPSAIFLRSGNCLNNAIQEAQNHVRKIRKPGRVLPAKHGADGAEASFVALAIATR